MTLRARLAVAAGAVVVVFAIVGTLMLRAVSASQLDQVDHQLLGALPVVMGLGPEAGPPPGLPSGNTSSPTPLSDLYVAAIQSSARTVKLAPSSTGGRAPSTPAVAATSGADSPLPVTVGSMSGEGEWRAVLVSLPDGSVWLLAIPLDRVDATTQQLAFGLLLAGVVVVLVMGAAGWWLVRLGLQPIAEVTEVADAITRGDRTRRVSTQRPGTEASHLADAMNLMLDEQHEGNERLRQFVADASHELRTPVAAIGGFADLWRQGALDDSQIDDVMRRIGQESARVRELVEDLLLLARLDNRQELVRAPVDLAAVAADVRLDCSATHPSRIVHVDAKSPAIVHGDSAQLIQVVRNLVDNALVHSGPSAQVTVTTRVSGDMAVISVADDGLGMTPAEVNRAFDRFWRADAARSQPGSGLGLSIVRGIVEAHLGRTVIESRPGTGTTVKVVLPSNVAGPGDRELQQTRNSPQVNPEDRA